MHKGAGDRRPGHDGGIRALPEQSSAWSPGRRTGLDDISVFVEILVDGFFVCGESSGPVVPSLEPSGPLATECPRCLGSKLTAVATTRPPERHYVYRTRGLGCRAEIWVTDMASLVGATEILEQEVARIDGAASRFRPDAEISRVERAQGHPVGVSPCLFEAVTVALRVAAATDGAVDPTVGNAMVRLGYDRDFAEVALGVAGSLPEKHPVPGWQSIELDPENRTVRVPPGTVIDLGATAKALTADRIARRVSTTLGCGVLVSLGGDIAVGGSPPPGGFRVGVADVSEGSEACETVAIRSGGLATSGLMSRRWRLGDHTVDHIVDPRTGLPPRPVWRTVTTTAATCVDANAASTAAIVKGGAAVRWLEFLQIPSRLVAVDGHISRVAGWPPVDPATSELAESIR